MVALKLTLTLLLMQQLGPRVPDVLALEFLVDFMRFFLDQLECAAGPKSGRA